MGLTGLVNEKVWLPAYSLCSASHGHVPCPGRAELQSQLSHTRALCNKVMRCQRDNAKPPDGSYHYY